MRISTAQINLQATNAMLDQQVAASKTQLQISSGRRILTPADDPVGASRVLALSQSVSVTEQFQSNINAAESKLRLEETALGSVTNALQRVRELALQGNNDTNTAQDRDAIAVEVRELLDGLLRVANSQDESGEYLFAGFKTQTQPFSASGSTFSYSGDQGQRLLAVGPGRRIASGDSGFEVFMRIPNGNGTFVASANGANTGTGVIDQGSVVTSFVPENYTITITEPTPGDLRYSVTGSVSGAIATNVVYADGQAINFGGIGVTLTGTPAAGDSFTVQPSSAQSLFDTVQAIAAELEAGGGAPAADALFHTDLGRAISELDQGLEKILEMRAGAGARLNALDNQAEINADYQLQLQTTLSEVQDLDYAEAISRFELQLVALQAAQQSFSRISGLSLFNFL